MRKTFLKVSILGMLTVGMAAGFTSCKDYDDDIDNLQTQIDAIQKDLKEIQDLVKSGVVITSVSQNADGVTITMSNNQTYNIKNGADGKPGKDADVWTIVKNAEGKYVWAKNDVPTDFPAQGEPGKPGAGIYYEPNKDGYFYKVEDGKEPVKTDIPCFAPGAITAIDNGSEIIISGILDKDGKETEPFVLSKTGALSSLEFIPDLYVDGIETMRAQYANGTKTKPTTSANGENITGDVIVIGETGKAKGTIAKDAIIEFEPASGDNKTYTNNAKNVAKYILNPANANLTGISYSYKTNVATVESRAAENLLTVDGQPTKDENGDLVVNFTIADYSKIYDQNGNVKENNAQVFNKQTVAALMATLPDNSVVASNFVAVETQKITFAAIEYTYKTDAWKPAYDKAYAAGKDASVLNGIYDETLKLPYNAVSNLPEYLRVSYTISKKDANGESKPTTEYYTLAELAEKFGYTMNYSLLDYTTGAAKTEEAKYAKIAADGTLTPQYVNAAGQSVDATDGSKASRTAIGRMPVVILQLKDADGNLILGGFVKIVYGEKATVESISLGDKALANVCNASIVTPWDVFAGKVVAATGMTMQQFQAAYKLNTNVIGVQEGNEIKEYNLTGYTNYCTPAINTIGGNAATQSFTFTFSQAQIENWYPTYDEDGEQDGTKLTQEPQTKTIYGKFEDKTSNSVIWIGYNVTVTGLPTVTYTGKLASQWVAGKDLVPAHPAIVSDAAYGVKPNLITFTTASLWNKGVPALKYAAPFQNTDNKATDTYVTNEAVDYTFAAKQNDITTNAKNSDGKNKVYAFAGNDTKLYGIEITGLTGDALKNARKAVAAGTGAGVEEFATIDGGIFKITAKTGMVDDVVNTNAFSMSDPKTLFNVEMNLTYGSCNLVVPAFGNFNVGIGRPVDVVAADKMMEITDGGASYTRPLYDLAMVQDWQSNKFWKKEYVKDEDGKDTEEVKAIVPNVLNGTDVYAFWTGNNTPNAKNGWLTFGWDADLDKDELAKVMLTNTTPDVATAVAGARKGFNIKFGFGPNANQKNFTQMNVYTASDLFNAYVEYQKYGEGATTITEAFYVFVPVKATYVWGTSNIGYATIKINPTHMGE